MKKRPIIIIVSVFIVIVLAATTYEIWYGRKDTERKDVWVEKTINKEIMKTDADCGIVSVKMLLDFYDINVSYAELEKNLKTTSEGTKWKDIKNYLNTIDKVEIINNNYVLGGMIFGGIIHLYTKKKNFAGLIDTKNLTFSEFKGYSGRNKFPEIKYTDEIALNSRKADYRNTLYWNPEITTDENGEANISFYTSDEKGKFLITIEGVGESGENGSKKIILEVE